MLQGAVPEMARRGTAGLALGTTMHPAVVIIGSPKDFGAELENVLNTFEIKLVDHILNILGLRRLNMDVDAI